MSNWRSGWQRFLPFLESRRATVDWFVLGAAGLGAGYLWLSSPPPGYAIGLLAAVAAIMAFSKPTVWQRMVVIGLAVTLYYIETRAIDHDRRVSANESADNVKQILSDNRTKTEAILNDNQTRFSYTTGQPSGVNTSIATNAAIATESLNGITGGDSWGWVDIVSGSADGASSLSIINAGKKYPLRGVRIAAIIKGPPLVLQQFDVGDVAPHTGYLVPGGQQLYLDKSKNNDITFVIGAINGSTYEDVTLKWAGAGWAKVGGGTVYRVTSDGKHHVLRQLP